ncbi:MAG TPA: EAL domain-containing protein [Candidatus Limnocylindrales bacterium]
MARAGHLVPARASGPAAAERGVLLAPWRTSGWAAYGLLGLLGVGAYFLVATQRQQDLAYDLYGLGAVAAILVGVRVHRPARRAAWLTLALGVALVAAGDLTLSFLSTSTGSEPFPSVADALYLAGYAALAYGLVQLARRDGWPHDQAAWVDALIVAGAATVVVWTLVFDSYLADSTLSPLGLLVSAAYPFADLVLLAVVTHLLLVSRRAQFSLTLLALGFGANLLADTWYIFQSIDSTYQVGQLVDAGWLIGYLAWGAAALHPAMARVGEHSGEARPARGGLSRLRLALLACGAGVAPAAAIGAAARGAQLDILSVLLGSALLYLLVLYRVVLSLREQRELTVESARLAVALQDQASHDPLTGLENRTAFVRQLERALQRRRRTGEAVTVLYLDLDRLKAVSDYLGHAAGDEVLMAAGQRLRKGILSATAIGRLGGDEFVVLLEGEDEDAAHSVAARVNDLLAAPVVVEGHPCFVSASVGVAVAVDDERPDQLLRRADLAMYQAKSSGGAAHAVYSPLLDAAVRERLTLEADLRLALVRGELCLYYQPIVELATGRITGLETLVRWLHPVRGLLLPGAFLPVAEASDLMDPLERWVLRTAIGQAIEWQRAGTLRRPQVLNINVSARHLATPGFLREIAAALAGSGLGPGSIALELTETDLVRDTAQVEHAIAALRRAGVRVVIDDFGTAYASMSYLADFPVDGIKIDRVFVSVLDTDPSPRTRLAEAMVYMARGLGISAVAEGVETPAQAAALARMGCLYAQGYLFGRPLPASDAAELLAAGRVEAVPADPAPAPPPSDLHRAGRLSVPPLRGRPSGAAEGWPDGRSPVGIEGARPARGRPSG